MLAKPQRGLRICFRVVDMYVQEEEADRTGNLWQTEHLLHLHNNWSIQQGWCAVYATATGQGFCVF